MSASWWQRVVNAGKGFVYGIKDRPILSSVVGIGLPSLTYYLHRRQARLEAIRLCNEFIISPQVKEIEDLEQRIECTDEVWESAQRAARLSGRNCVRPDQLAEAVQHAAASQTTRAKPFQGWDLLCLYRTAPMFKPLQALNLPDVLVGLALLATPEQEENKLRYAWRAMDPSYERALRFDELSQLLTSMERMGHFQSESLVRQERYLPANYNILTGQGIAELYYKHLQRSSSEPITFEEFVQVAKHHSEKGKVVLWYLKAAPDRQRRREKKREKEEKQKQKEADAAAQVEVSKDAA